MESIIMEVPTSNQDVAWDDAESKFCCGTVAHFIHCYGGTWNFPEDFLSFFLSSSRIVLLL